MAQNNSDLANELRAEFRKIQAATQDRPEVGLEKIWEQNVGKDETVAYEAIERAALTSADPNIWNKWGYSLLQCGYPEKAAEIFCQLFNKHELAPANYQMACEYAGIPVHLRKPIDHCYNFAFPPHPALTHKIADKPRRIIYISPDGYNHACGRLISEAISGHDRDAYHITYLHDNNTYDGVTEQIRSNVDLFMGVEHIPSWELYNLIYSLNPHCLVDTSGYSSGGNRLPLFARHPAPIQITMIGYPGEMILPFFDARIGSSMIGWQTTRTLVNNRGYTPYSPLDVPGLAISERMQRITNAGPDYMIQAACIESPSKLSEQDIAYHAEILRDNPNVELTYARMHGQYSHDKTQQIMHAHRDSGARVAIVDVKSNYIELLMHSDIILGTSIWSSHVKAMDAVSMGIPIVCGDDTAMAPSRLTREVYRGMGLSIQDCDMATTTGIAAASQRILDTPIPYTSTAWTRDTEGLINRLIYERLPCKWQRSPGG